MFLAAGVPLPPAPNARPQLLPAVGAAAGQRRLRCPALRARHPRRTSPASSRPVPGAATTPRCSSTRTSTTTTATRTLCRPASTMSSVESLSLESGLRANLPYRSAQARGGADRRLPQDPELHLQQPARGPDCLEHLLSDLPFAPKHGHGFRTQPPPLSSDTVYSAASASPTPCRSTATCSRSSAVRAGSASRPPTTAPSPACRQTATTRPSSRRRSPWSSSRVKELMLYGNYIQALQQGPIARRRTGQRRPAVPRLSSPTSSRSA